MTTTIIKEDCISRKWVVKTIASSYWKLFLKYGLLGGLVTISIFFMGTKLQWHPKLLSIICFISGLPFIFYLSILLGSLIFYIPQSWFFTQDKIIAKGFREFATINRKNIIFFAIDKLQSLEGYTKIHVKSKEWFGLIETNFEIIVHSNQLPKDIHNFSEKASISNGSTRLGSSPDTVICKKELK